MAQPAQPALAPVQNEGAPNAIPGQYIVVFQPDTARNVVTAAQNRIKALGGTVGHTYTSALIGFSAKLPPQAVQALRAVPGVAYIEADKRFWFDTIWTQNSAPAGLDRIDQRPLPLDTNYSYDGKGTGVHVYVIDTGIWIAHAEFGGRAVSSYSIVADLDDCFGHGTHVAATIGGKTFGVAKEVTLHSVRVADATCAPSESGTVKGIDWVTANRILPAVANISIGGPQSAPVETAVAKSIALGVTYVVSAGNDNADACGQSPANVRAAITVGASDPTNDTRASNSNWGPCLDLFAPGVNIVSAMPNTLPAIPGCTIISNTPGSRTQRCSGTSAAVPYVTGVVARYLASFPSSTPAQVWARIDLMANVFPTTTSWPGIISPGTGSPNKLLHWGAVDDTFDDGDPHITTVGGVHYDFQSAGEFVVLRDGNGLEIQTRQSPVTTQPPFKDPYTGLATCVSLNTAIAARVGTRRVTYQPNLSGQPDPSGLQLRVDGALRTLGAQPIDLGPRARVMKSTAGDGIEIDFPDGTSLIATPNFWGPPHNRWYLNLSVFHTPATEGIMGALAPGSWLPALPDGASLGPKPAALPQRYVDLYQKFANAWRVTHATSLFDYAPGTSTATFTLASWPPENPPCVVPDSPPARPVIAFIAQKLCAQIVDKTRKADCVFDVGITGEEGFAKIYLIADQIRAVATRTIVNDDKDPTQYGDVVTFTATVALKASGGKAIPTGKVQFTLDGVITGDPVKLNAKGQATWKTSRLAVGNHRVGAFYLPAKGSGFHASTSFDQPHAVINKAAKAN